MIWTTLGQDMNGQYWTGWSEWTGCRGIDHGMSESEFKKEFCSHPSRYLAKAISYRECRKPDPYNPAADFNHDNISDYRNTKPTQGDPENSHLPYSTFKFWYSGVKKFVSTPSTRLGSPN